MRRLGILICLALAACGSPKPALQIGITEQTPAFIAGDAPPAFARWQRELRRIRPTYVRVLLDWKALTAGLSAPQTGCLREVQPCAPYAGLTAQLAAIRTAQRADPGRYRAVFVVFDAPQRCPDLAADTQLVRDVQRAAKGVDVAAWGPWDEPTRHRFLPCGDYGRLAEAMRSVVGDHLLIGELASNGTDLLSRLPQDLVCTAVAVGQHDYANGADPLPALERELARCPHPPPVWITETGVRHDRYADSCPAMQQTLARFRRAGVRAVFQYSLREDPLNPTGLVHTDLRRAYPELALWEGASCSTATAGRAPAR